MRRVVVAAAAAATPHGGTAASIDAALSGLSAPLSPCPGLSVSVARYRGELPNAATRVNALAVAAFSEVAASAGLGPKELKSAGLICGTSKGALDELLLLGPEGLEPYLRGPAAAVADALGCLGPLLAPAAACATGTVAVALGASAVASGQADLLLVGAAESALHPLLISGYMRMGVYSSRGRVAPFSRDRDGFIAGEGAGALVLEEENHALARGVRPLCRLSSWAFGSDPGSAWNPAPDGAPLYAVLRRASSGLSHPPAVVLAHGTATAAGDVAEAAAVAALLGRGAPVAALKGCFGHLLGAAGAVELAVIAHSVARGVLPPVAGLPSPDAVLPVRPLDKPSPLLENCVLAIGAGFGGHLAAVGIEPWG